MTIESALIIRAPWIDLILQGKKTWEMRSMPTRIRGTIGLIRQGSGQIVGTARLLDSKPALTRDDYMRYRDMHAIPESMLDDVLVNRWVVPWVLSEVRRLPKPVPYKHKSGAVLFVTLEPSVRAAIAAQNDGAPIEASLAQLVVSPTKTPSSGATPTPIVTRAASPACVPNDEPTFVFRPEAAQAYGRPFGRREFVVLAGSTAMRLGSAKVKRDEYERDRLVRAGVLIPDADARLYRFAIDHTFASSSQAAGVVKDGNGSGPSLWKDETTGRSLQDHLSAL